MSSRRSRRYVADDGGGIEPNARERVFEMGYSQAHGRSVSVTDSEAGGARFEFDGVERDA
ncbi:hypothetical protein [Halapricum desulfuricans]|uniref:Signal transduction histidine kinase, contains PAS domain n=1 Tax=Halapricum desulfuricans TaxID=2841257 RepID=A0A897NKQ4_9EURY|nr:hypothetical protein [Halapricum desulfuricans]QSG10382.1 Signal transduction histidine kinase, contains PAS domain [Halapricum desulfuricans]QSG13332.1 Signal transduction histidine kinase, contains PAS domain [Halapricum desulfuricans]